MAYQCRIRAIIKSEIYFHLYWWKSVAVGKTCDSHIQFCNYINNLHINFNKQILIFLVQTSSTKIDWHSLSCLWQNFFKNNTFLTAHMLWLNSCLSELSWFEYHPDNWISKEFAIKVKCPKFESRCREYFTQFTKLPLI